MKPRAVQLAASCEVWLACLMPTVPERDNTEGPLLEPSDCALVVVDMQNDFCHANGAASRFGQDTSLVRAMLPSLLELVNLAREACVPRIYTRQVQSPWFDPPSWRERGRGGTTLDVRDAELVQEGSWGADFFGVAPREDELVITKCRYSAFAYTPVELALRTCGASTVVLAGTQTNVCVEATAVDALAKGFYVVVVSDCVASGSTALHEAALIDIAERIGPPASLEDLRREWSRASSGGD